MWDRPSAVFFLPSLVFDGLFDPPPRWPWFLTDSAYNRVLAACCQTFFTSFGALRGNAVGGDQQQRNAGFFLLSNGGRRRGPRECVVQGHRRRYPPQRHRGRQVCFCFLRTWVFLAVALFAALCSNFLGVFFFWSEELHTAKDTRTMGARFCVMWAPPPCS